MFRFIVSLTLALTLLSPALDWRNKEFEFKYLRSMLKVSDDTPVTVVDSLKLPDATPLKAFNVTSNEVVVSRHFAEWIDNWNNGDGKKYGVIEIVPEMSQADVLLVRYALPFAEIERDETAGGISATPAIDPATRQPVNTPNMTTTVKFIATIYSYVILKAPEGIKILRRIEDKGTASSSLRYATLRESSSDESMRIGQKIANGELIVKGRKDSKVPGDKLRDEFFKMIKATSGKK
jgi:hypothetical protein